MFLFLFLNLSPFLLFLLFHQDTIEHWRSGQIFPHCLDSGISFRVVLRWGRGKALATTCISCALTAQHHASAAKEKPKARSICFPGLESSNSERYTSKESSQHYYCLKVNTNCSKWNTCQFWNNEQADWNEGGGHKTKGGGKFSPPFRAEAYSTFTCAQQLHTSRPSARSLPRKHYGDQVVISLQ